MRIKMANQTKTHLDFDPTTAKNIQQWLDGDYDSETKAKIRQMVQENPQEAIDSFYTELEFGTGGMRGIMGVGANRLNQYTIRSATQGLANYLFTQPVPPEGYSVFIGYDSRHNSRFFAEEAAKVLAGNDIKVYLSQDICPTPLVSFGCRNKKCSSAIMVTASHNPPEYNGYKVYWNDGAQVLPPHDKGIIEEVKKITDLKMIKKVDSLNNPLINEVGEEIHAAYINAVYPLQLQRLQNQKLGYSLHVVYTSLHGTGITVMPKMLASWGFTTIDYVKKQIIPDGNFPTCHSPNPEEKEALKMGLETLKEVNGDILIATDPDADRVGIAINHQGELHILNGNQIACICLEYICHTMTAQKNMPDKAAFIKTIVTTELFQEIVQSYHKYCFNVLTGFKYIAEKIREWEADYEGFKYIFGGEESYGYLFGTETRDKDALLTSALICEVALHAKLQGKTLIDLLHDIWKKHGVYVEMLMSVKFDESKAGKEQMARGMSKLQHNTPKMINNIEVLAIDDYENSLRTDLKTGTTTPLTLPKSEVLVFWLADKSKVVARPSGTEPKIKLYCGVVNKNYKDILGALESSKKHAEELLKALKEHLYS